MQSETIQPWLRILRGMQKRSLAPALAEEVVTAMTSFQRIEDCPCNDEAKRQCATNRFSIEYCTRCKNPEEAAQKLNDFFDALDSESTWVPWHSAEVRPDHEINKEFIPLLLHSVVTEYEWRSLFEAVTCIHHRHLLSATRTCIGVDGLARCMCCAFYGTPNSVHFDEAKMWSWLMHTMIPRVLEVSGFAGVVALLLSDVSPDIIIKAGMAHHAYNHYREQYDESFCFNIIFTAQKLLSMFNNFHYAPLRNAMKTLPTPVIDLLTECQKKMVLEGQNDFLATATAMAADNPDEALAFIGNELSVNLGQHTEFIFDVVSRCSIYSVNGWIDNLLRFGPRRYEHIDFAAYMFPVFRLFPRLFECFLKLFHRDILERVSVCSPLQDFVHNPEDDPCAVCMQPVVESGVRCEECGKPLHGVCLGRWEAKTCPSCRADMIHIRIPDAKLTLEIRDAITGDNPDWEIAFSYLEVLSYQKEVVDIMLTWEIGEWIMKLARFLHQEQCAILPECVLSLAEMSVLMRRTDPLIMCVE